MLVLWGACILFQFFCGTHLAHSPSDVIITKHLDCEKNTHLRTQTNPQKMCFWVVTRLTSENCCAKTHDHKNATFYQKMFNSNMESLLIVFDPLELLFFPTKVWHFRWVFQRFRWMLHLDVPLKKNTIYSNQSTTKTQSTLVPSNLVSTKSPSTESYCCAQPF